MPSKTILRKETPHFAGFSRDLTLSKNAQLIELLAFVSKESKSDVSEIEWKGDTIKFEIDGHYDLELTPIGYLVWDGTETEFTTYTNTEYHSLFTEVNSDVGSLE